MIKASLLAILFAAGSSGLTSQAATTLVNGVAKVEVWRNDGGGTAVSDLTSDPHYPSSPTYVKTLKYLEYPPGADDGTAPAGDVFNSYGDRISGYITPTDTADYIFYIAADDNAAFFLSTDDQAAHATQVAYEPQWNPVRNWAETTRRNADAPENKSAPIHLEGGKHYAFYTLHKEGGGGDNVAVTWIKSGDPDPDDTQLPIGSEFLSADLPDPNVITISSQPGSTAATEGSTATFSVSSSTPDVTYQWFENGTAIDGATDFSFTLDPVATTDNNAKFHVVLTSKDGSKTLTSKDATLTVLGTRGYTTGALRFDFFNGAASIDPTLLGTPLFTYGAGGGTDPDLTQAIPAFDSRAAFPDDSHDNYDGAITGFFLPDQDGTYYFHLKSDDPGQLYMNVDPADSTRHTLIPDTFPDLTVDNDGDGIPDNVVANETGCCNDFAPAGDVKTGGPFNLLKGKKYAMVGLYHEGGGNDYLQVAFTRDGSTAGLDESDSRNSSTIPSQYLQAPAGGITGPDLGFVAHPQDLSIFENRSFKFSVTTSGAPGTSLQWQSAPAGSSTFTDIAGATGTSYSGTAPIGMNGTQYRVKAATTDGQAVTSEVATLTVLPDPVAPFVTAAYTFVDRTGVEVFFSEPVNAAAGTAGNYTLDGGASVSSVDVLNPQTVFLHTAAALDASKQYTLTLANIRDLASGAGNLISPTTFQFTTSGPAPAGTFTPGLIRYEYWKAATPLQPDALLATLLAGTAPAPDFSGALTAFDSPVNIVDDGGADFTYAGRLSGYFVPPQTGDYVFFTASDDHGALYLSTDSDPAHVKKIANENVWSNTKEWTISGGSSDLTMKRSDKYTGTQWPSGNTVSLVGGQKYFIEELWAETGGGDNGGVTYVLKGSADPANGTTAMTGTAIGDFFTPADVGNLPPVIIDYTTGLIAFSKGDKITLHANVIGKAPLTYQWYRNKLEITGATGPDYVINSADYTDVGDYYFTVSNDLGSANNEGTNGNTALQDDRTRLIMNGAFVIEAEDYNYGGGQHKPESDIMPYAGDVYKGLIPTPDFDMWSLADQSGGAAFTYQRGVPANPQVVEDKGPGDNVDSATGRFRGSFSVVHNYALGWTRPGDWQNYTRVIPAAGKYAIIGAFAYDAGSYATDINYIDQTLEKVTTPTIADGSSDTAEGGAQGLTVLGSFTGPATGAWSSNDFIPLRDDTGKTVLVDLPAGAVTLRVRPNKNDGDFDFLLLYNTEGVVGPTQAHITVSRNTDGTLKISWDQAGTLQKTSKLLNAGTVWTDIAGPSPQNVTISGDSAGFFRIKQ
jgi:hypothetical protein